MGSGWKKSGLAGDCELHFIEMFILFIPREKSRFDEKLNGSNLVIDGGILLKYCK